MRHLVAASVLVALVVAVYGGTIDHEFVFDDWHLVVANEAVRWPLTQIPDLMRYPPGTISYRPLRIVSYMVDYQLGGGLHPSTFHRSNIAYHAACALALYALAFRSLGSFAGALFAAALFAAHPLGSEAAAYVAGRRDLLSTLFVLLGMVAWWAFLDSPRRRKAESLRLTAWDVVLLAAFAAFAMLALGAKETAAVAPLLALLLGIAHWRRTRGPVGARFWIGLAIALLALWLVIDAIYLERVRVALSRLEGAPLAPQPALTLTVLGRYLWLALWPVRLSADYTPPVLALPTSALDPGSAVALLVLLALVVVGAFLLWRGEIAGAGLLWFLVALLPVAQIVPYREVIAEHNTYLALAGLALAAGRAFAIGVERAPRGAIATAMILVALLAYRAHSRSADWRDDETLWRKTLETAPTSIRARLHLGLVYSDKGRFPEAQEILEQALAAAPDNPEVMLALGTVSEHLGSRDRALELTTRAATARPDAETLTSLGWIQYRSGRIRAARESFQRAVDLDPRAEEARRGLEASTPAQAPKQAGARS